MNYDPVTLAQLSFTSTLSLQLLIALLLCHDNDTTCDVIPVVSVLDRLSGLLHCTELEKSNMIAVSLEEKMRQAEQERQELEEARLRAEEAQRIAEEAAHMEKEERDRKVWLMSTSFRRELQYFVVVILCFVFFVCLVKCGFWCMFVFNLYFLIMGGQHCWP